MLKIRQADRDDVLAFYEDPIRESMRALVVEDSGQVIMIGGVLHRSPLTAFMDWIPDAKRHRRTIVLAARKFREILSLYSVPVYALAKRDEPGAERFLEYIGFRFDSESDEGRVFVCCQHS